MATYALASGRHVPETVMQAFASGVLGAIAEETDGLEGDGHALASTNHPRQDNATWQDRLEQSIRQLTYAHNRLADIITPATPRTILFLQASTQRAGAKAFLGIIPFVRRLMYTAMVLLLGVILIRIFLHMNVFLNILPQDENALIGGGGAVFLQQLHLMTAAGLGASFAVLFEVNTTTLKAAFDPLYEPSYWARFALGLIAGVVLADLVPIDPTKPLDPGVAQPTLALLGGFSASAVYRILVHLRTTIVSLIPAGIGDEADIQQRTSPARGPEPSDHLRLTVAASLISLQQRLATSMSPEQLKQELDGILADLLASDEIDH